MIKGEIRRKRKGHSAETIRECYGVRFGALEKCKKCFAKKWCRTAKYESPDLHIIHPDQFSWKFEDLKAPPQRDTAEYERPIYSQADLVELLGFIFSLDFRVFEVLRTRFDNPDDSLAQIAAKRKISRQALHKLMQKRIKQIPEIAAAFNFYKKRQSGSKALPDDLPEFETPEELESHWNILTELYEIKKQVLIEGGYYGAARPDNDSGDSNSGLLDNPQGTDGDQSGDQRESNL